MGMLGVLRKSLVLLRRAIKGLIVMSADLEEMFNAFLINKVPPHWSTHSYPSLKPLASWFANLVERMKFMHAWNKNGMPKSFCMPYIYFTVGFLTGAMQSHARKHVIPIDSLNFSFEMTTHAGPADLEAPPDDGVYVDGLFIEAARFDMDSMTLQPSLLGQPRVPLPIIHFLPVEDYEVDPSHYQCPTYRTSVRAGVLTTTGASSNYVIDLSIPCDRDPAFFVLQGTAALTMLDD